MILYTDEARESWKQTAQDLKQKVAVISGSELNTLEAGRLASILEMFCEYVDKEAKTK